jgi:hypothetical protein
MINKIELSHNDAYDERSMQDGGLSLMITIPLSDHAPLRSVISYSVSPLFELAASLHMLAQSQPHERLADWTENTLAAFQRTRLLEEWHYFSPVFRAAIPDAFDPLHTKGVMAVDDQYDYFVTLPTAPFVRSLRAALQGQSGGETSTLIDDLEHDPDFVKGRFSLFISSYWQLLFEAKWEEIAPLFVREAEAIEHALHDKESLLSHLQQIHPGVRYNLAEGRLEFSDNLPAEQASNLVLYPSHFYAGSPFLTKKGQNAHLVYSFHHSS